MKTKIRIPGTEDAWDNRELGADEQFVKVAEGSDAEEAAIDEALELRPISIRLQKSLIEDFKLIAQLAGVGYQPLMRQVLTRFVDCEKKRILRDVVSDFEKRKQEETADDNDEGPYIDNER